MTGFYTTQRKRKAWDKLQKEIEEEGPEAQFADLEFFGLSIK